MTSRTEKQLLQTRNSQVVDRTHLLQAVVEEEAEFDYSVRVVFDLFQSIENLLPQLLLLLEAPDVNYSFQ
jgi:hypothetical protein